MYFGFDIDALAGCGYQDLIELLGSMQDQPVIAHIINLLHRCPGETIEAEIARLGRVMASIDADTSALRSLLGDTRCGELHEWALTLRDSLEFVRVANPAKDYKTLSMALAAREETLLRHVEFILEQMGSNGKLVLMGHNRHLAKDFGGIKNPGGAPPGGNRVPSLGTSLNHLLPGQVFSIWSLYDHGLSSQPYASLSHRYRSAPGSLNALLAEVGSVCLLPTTSTDPRAHLLTQELDIVGIYNQVFRTAITKQADAVFFLPEVSPLQE
jgi:erythromycin esterase-like protein